MKEIISQLTPSDYIQICGILTALLASIISIIISIVSIRQNSKIIKESNMAQIEIFPFRMYGEPINRITIKNFGNTTGIILDISLTPTNALNEMLINPFEYYKNMSLAPNQSFTAILQNKTKDEIDPFDITIKYKTLNKIKISSFHIDYNFTNGLLETSPSPFIVTSIPLEIVSPFTFLIVGLLNENFCGIIFNIVFPFFSFTAPIFQSAVIFLFLMYCL